MIWGFFAPFPLPFPLVDLQASSVVLPLNPLPLPTNSSSNCMPLSPPPLHLPRVSPLADNANDGLSLMPYEAMFVPLSTADDVDMPYGFPADTAKRYSEWALQVRREWCFRWRRRVARHAASALAFTVTFCTVQHQL